MAGSESNGNATTADASTTASKPKRVRTGCLTCRERHLKCDEGSPDCQNCRRSNRVCKRGVRLNFIDTQVQSPPMIPPTHDWLVQFQDDSREIASEYKGGLGRYPSLDQDLSSEVKREMPFEFPANVTAANTMSHQALPPIQPLLPTTYPDPSQENLMDQSRDSHHHHTSSNAESTYSAQNGPAVTSSTSYSNPEQTLTPPSESRDYLNSPEEVLFMQVFVEEVGLWMDSMDPMKHFSRLLPFHSLGEPMLLNAFLACGARHLTLVNPGVYHEDKALHYYDTATRGLLKSLQNPNRDTVICATTAVILNVYEIMSERALQRMNHIAGARALIKECGWSARSTGIGAACFWINVGMELLSCLHFNWQVAWEPDDWGVDMDFSRETESGREEVWTHRIVYIVAKIANFRASIPRFQEPSARDEQLRLQNRFNQWKSLRDWCESWNENIPRTMHPMAYLYPYQTTSKSAFPEVWLIKRTTIVARLFYHTAMCLLAQMNPTMSTDVDEMHDMQMSHAHQICGIVVHVKDRYVLRHVISMRRLTLCSGVASVALRSLAIAAECLTVRREQEEVLQIVEKIMKETGWRVGFLKKELPEKWGWNQEEPLHPQQQPQPQQQQMPTAMMQNQVPYQFQPSPQGSTQSSLPPAPPVQRRIPSGITNPLMATADFSSQHHPYQSYYVAPNQHPHHSHYNF
ncbi:MAG: hypothetical protein M1812_001887 [Candelaria pacifica]|nr:MAG: hypothetical protein M1812_001887 [Candelaria pacifica]